MLYHKQSVQLSGGKLNRRKRPTVLRRSLFSLLLLFLASSPAFTQWRSEIPEQSKFARILHQPEEREETGGSKRYWFNLHCGVDVFGKGIHVGSMVYVHEHLSLETSFGADALMFLVALDENFRYSIGLNWHKGGDSHLFTGITYTYLDFTTPLEKKQSVLSAMVGSYIIDEDWIQGYYRGGLALNMKDNLVGRRMYLWPNIDVGFSINLF